VKFKFFGMLGLTLVFVIVQTLWLTRAVRKKAGAQAEQE
jgi:intracellular septation protein A